MVGDHPVKFVINDQSFLTKVSEFVAFQGQIYVDRPLQVFGIHVPVKQGKDSWCDLGNDPKLVEYNTYGE